MKSKDGVTFDKEHKKKLTEYLQPLGRLSSLHQKVKVWVTSAPALENSTANCSTALHIKTQLYF